jgi:tungstate transport system ATP-binding protein
LSAPQELVIARLTKRLGARAVLDVGPVSFSTGTLHVIEGDNGAGKSTLLKCTGGLESADEIHLTFAGQSFAGGPYPAALRSAIVYVHQHPYLFSGGVVANLDYGLQCRNLTAETRKARIRDAITWAGLEYALNTPPRKFSGGEKQRLALARAVALEPQVLLADEPTANLDQVARGQVHALLESLVARGTLVIVATHDPALLGKAGAQRWLLNAGALTKN